MTYTIKADGAVLWCSGVDDDKAQLLSPRLSLDVDKAGTLSFVLLPGHPMYSTIQRLKTTITVEQDGVEIFRGRIIDDSTDLYKQRSINCESDVAYLVDSLMRPYSVDCTAYEFFVQLIETHNSQVDFTRRFSVGNVTVDNVGTRVKTSSPSYDTVSTVLDSKLLGVFGGYLCTRQAENGTRLIEWLKEPGDVNGQTITFAVNLLDLKSKIDTDSIFTALIPLGATEVSSETGSISDALTIKSVNNGLDYLVDEAGVAAYGYIWRTYTWDSVTDAQTLLQKGQAYLAGGAAAQTLTLKAIDMHILDGAVQAILPGHKVHIVSDPHGIDQTTLCSKAAIDLVSPEQTQYTFGQPERTLTENIMDADPSVAKGGGGSGGGGGKKVDTMIEKMLTWAEVNRSVEDARFEITTGRLNTVTADQTSANIRLDGLEATIDLKAFKTYTDEDGVIHKGEAEILVDGAKAEINLKVDKDGVIGAINITPETITISASKINLNGYVTATALDAVSAKFDNLVSGATTATKINAKTVTIGMGGSGSFGFLGTYAAWKTATIAGTTIHYLGY